MRRTVGAVLVLLITAASCSSGGLETPAETLQRDDPPRSSFGYALEPVPPGYELCAVTVPSALSLTTDTEASLFVYGDGRLDDPYDGPLYGIASFPGGPVSELALGPTVEVDVGGVVGRLGTVEGLQVAALPAAAGRLLTVPRGDDEVLQLVVRGDDQADLVELASWVLFDEGVATLDMSRMPEGTVELGDLYQLEGRPRFRFALDYQARSAEGEVIDQVTLLGSMGDAASMQAFRFRAASSRMTEVNGWPAVVADIGATGDGPNVVSWLVDDELILRVFSFAIAPEELVRIAESAEVVAAAAWDDVVSRFDPATCQS